MFNKQLKRNINDLDVQIGKLSGEIEKLRKVDGYGVKMEKLEALTELRVKLAKSLGKDGPKDSVDELDRQIKDLTIDIRDIERDSIHAAKLKELEELIKARSALTENKVKESYAPHVISGVASIGAMLLVLNYEKTNIVTSKAFSLVTRMFRG